MVLLLHGPQAAELLLYVSSTTNMLIGMLMLPGILLLQHTQGAWRRGGGTEGQRDRYRICHGTGMTSMHCEHLHMFVPVMHTLESQGSSIIPVQRLYVCASLNITAAWQWTAIS